jgi:hypothetical protein
VIRRPSGASPRSLRPPLRLVLALALVAPGACRREEAAAPDAGHRPLSLVRALEEEGAGLEDVRRRGEVHAALARAHLAAGDEAAAEAALTAGLAAAESFDPPSERERAELGIALAWLAAGRLDRAVELARRVPPSTERDRVLTTLAVARVRSGGAEAATALVEAIGDTEARAEARAAVGEALGEAGQVAAARKLAAAVDGAGRDRVLLAVLRAQLRQGQLREAEKTQTFLQAGLERSRGQAELALARLRRGQLGAAEREVGSVESGWIRARTFALMASRALGARSRRQAEAFDARVDEELGRLAPSLAAAAREDVAAVYLEAGRPDRVRAVAQGAEGEVTKRKILSTLVVTHAGLGQLEAAQRLLPEVEPDAVWGSEALAALARARAGRKEWADALRLVTRIRLLELRLPALADVVVAHARSGEVPSALLDGLVRQALRPDPEPGP